MYDLFETMKFRVGCVPYAPHVGKAHYEGEGVDSGSTAGVVAETVIGAAAISVESAAIALE